MSSGLPKAERDGHKIGFFAKQNGVEHAESPMAHKEKIGIYEYNLYALIKNMNIFLCFLIIY